MSPSREAAQAAQAIAAIRQRYFQNLVMCGVPRTDIAELERQLAADTTITLPRGLAQYSELLAVLGGRSTYVSNLKTMLQLGLWEQSKIIYRLDGDLAHDLGNLGDGDVIHRDVLRRLPHPNPYIHLPAPILFTKNSGRTMQVRGFFVSGSRYDGDDPVLCSTHHPQRQHLVLLFPRLPYPGAGGSADADMSEIEFSRFNLKVRRTHGNAWRAHRRHPAAVHRPHPRHAGRRCRNAAAHEHRPDLVHVHGRSRHPPDSGRPLQEAPPAGQGRHRV
ncbi:hypothetical protein [Catellatospora methionotrophica]|uniref:hypothetical protein n=1 Tax=Catellatospora methionotrophica TaxID=121620 RepID=UPI00340FF571